MLKLLFTLLTDPLGLPMEPLWEYVILLIVGEIVHEIAWNISPGGVLGSPIYWVTKLLAFVLIWAALYVIIVAFQFVIAHWIWFTIGAAILIVASIAFIIWRRLHCQL